MDLKILDGMNMAILEYICLISRFLGNPCKNMPPEGCEMLEAFELNSCTQDICCLSIGKRSGCGWNRLTGVSG